MRLPPGEDLNEWLAVNTVDFYNAISVLHSTLEEYCTPANCPVMAAGSKVRKLRHNVAALNQENAVYRVLLILTCLDLQHRESQYEI